MAFFDFLKKKKEPLVVQGHVAEKQPKSGFYQEKEYISARVGGLPPEPITLEGNRNENGLREGRWIVKDEEGREGFIHYKDGIKHGLEKSLSGGYTLYYGGQVARSNLELTSEWKRELKEYKVMAKDEKDNGKNSSKLKKLLEEGEEKWLESFSKRFIEC